MSDINTPGESGEALEGGEVVLGQEIPQVVQNQEDKNSELEAMLMAYGDEATGIHQMFLDYQSDDSFQALKDLPLEKQLEAFSLTLSQPEHEDPATIVNSIISGMQFARNLPSADEPTSDGAEVPNSPLDSSEEIQLSDLDNMSDHAPGLNLSEVGQDGSAADQATQQEIPNPSQVNVSDTSRPATPGQEAHSLDANEDQIAKDRQKLDQDRQKQEEMGQKLADAHASARAQSAQNEGGGGGGGSLIDAPGIITALGALPFNVIRNTAKLIGDGFVGSKNLLVDGAAATKDLMVDGVKGTANAAGVVKDKINLKSFADKSDETDARVKGLDVIAQAIMNLAPGAPAHEHTILTEQFKTKSSEVLQSLDAEAKAGFSQVKRGKKSKGDLEDSMQSREEQVMEIFDKVINSEGAKQNPEVLAKVESEKESMAKKLKEMAEKILNLIKSFFKRSSPSPSPS